LNSCAQQAAGLVHPMRGLDNLERARLFDILLWASELAAKRGGVCPPKRSAQFGGS
jgi:hydrogenase/urease accessory protein HupE